MPEWIRECLLEEDPIRLKSIDSKSLLVHATLFPAHEIPLNAVGLIDSGCSARAFADLEFVTKNRIQTQLLPRPRSLLLADGKPAARITHYFVAPCERLDLYLCFGTVVLTAVPQFG